MLTSSIELRDGSATEKYSFTQTCSSVPAPRAASDQPDCSAVGVQGLISITQVFGVDKILSEPDGCGPVFNSFVGGPYKASSQESPAIGH